MALVEQMMYRKGRGDQERPEERREEKRNRCDQHPLGSLFETGHPHRGKKPVLSFNTALIKPYPQRGAGRLDLTPSAPLTTLSCLKR